MTILVQWLERCWFQRFACKDFNFETGKTSAKNQSINNENVITVMKNHNCINWNQVKIFLRTIGKEQERKKKVFVYRSHLELIDDIKRKKKKKTLWRLVLTMSNGIKWIYLYYSTITYNKKMDFVKDLKNSWMQKQISTETAVSYNVKSDQCRQTNRPA